MIVFHFKENKIIKSMFVLSKHISIKRSRCVRAENDQHGHPTPSEPRDTRIRNPVILVILEFRERGDTSKK